MWVDIAIAAILLISVIQGFRHGFVQTFIHAIGWILALVLGFVWYPHVIKFLKEKTDFYDSVHGTIVRRISENAENATDSLLKELPQLIRGILEKALETATNAISTSLANGLSNIIFSIIGFLLVVIAVKLILLFITGLLSKKSNEGLVGCFDGFFGLLAGALKGILLIYLLLAILVPFASLTGGAPLIMGELNQSILGRYLYDNNILFLIIESFLEGDPGQLTGTAI